MNHPRRAPLLMHVTTVDMSLELLLGPQLRAFRDAGYQVVGVSAPGPFVQKLEADGIAHISLRHATRRFALWSDVRAMVELFRLFRRLRPDIVHTHNPKPGVFGRIAARLARVPLVVNTQHGLYAQEHDGWRRKGACYGLERLAACFSHVELVQNEEDLATLGRLRVPSSKLTLLGNGVDLARFDHRRFSDQARAAARQELGATDTSHVVVGCVARLVEEKGIPELVEAARAVITLHPEIRFAIIGPADRQPAPRVRDAIQAGKQLGVAFLGSRQDVDRLYSGMDMFVLPSHREGFPRAVMEAAAMGLPTVGTKIRGMRQAIVEPETGSLVTVGDVTGLANAILHFATHTDHRRKAGQQAALLAAREFDIKRQISITLKAYQSLRHRTTLDPVKPSWAPHTPDLSR